MVGKIERRCVIGELECGLLVELVQYNIYNSLSQLMLRRGLEHNELDRVDIPGSSDIGDLLNFNIPLRSRTF